MRMCVSVPTSFIYNHKQTHKEQAEAASADVRPVAVSESVSLSLRITEHL